MGKKVLILALVCYLSVSLKVAKFENIHEFYFSYTDMRYNSEVSSIEIVMSIFIDDLDLVLDSLHHETFIGLKKERMETDSILFQYIQNHFAVQVDEHRVNYTFVGKETNMNTAEVYLEIPNIRVAPKVVKVFSTILKEQFDQQIQVLKYTVGDKTYTASILEKPFIHTFKLK